MCSSSNGRDRTPRVCSTLEGIHRVDSVSRINFRKSANIPPPSWECLAKYYGYVYYFYLCFFPQIWAPIAFLTSCLILATVNGALVYSSNLLSQYIDSGCFGLPILRRDTQAVAAFILAISVIAMIAQVVIVVIRAGQFGIRIKEINKYLTVLLVVVSRE